MEKIRTILIACFLASFIGATPVVAQQNLEQTAAYYFDHGEYAQAAQLYEGLYKRTTNKYYYQRLLATYLELGEYRDAVKLVERRRKNNSKDLYLYVDEGSVYLHQKDEKKAQKCFNKAIDAITADLQPVPDLAMAFINAGQLNFAARTYLTAREKTKNRTLYFNELIAVYQQMCDYGAMTSEYFDLLDNQPRMLNSVQVSMQKALQEAPDNKLADGVRNALVSRVREHPDNKTYLEMMIWFALQQKDFRFALEQAEAVDARFPDKGGQEVLRVAKIAQNNDALDVASDGYRILLAKGKDNPHYFESRIGELEVEFARINKNYHIEESALQQLAQKYINAFDELGKNERTLTLMRNYANLMGYHSSNIQAAADILDDILEMPRLKPQIRNEVKLELGDLLLFAGEVWDASLLYMQVEKENKNDVLGAMAKYKNAKLSYYNHDFEWANSQLKVLRSSTSKLVANDAMELSLLISDNMEDDSTYGMLEIFADADLLLYRNMLDSAWENYTNIEIHNLSHPLLDEVLMRKAQIRMKQARYTEADSLLQKVVDFYPYDITADDALIMMGELNEEKLNNTAKAIDCYEKLLLDYPNSLYTDRARKRYNALKTK
ncbi:MAG: tetratricopeptide repeat protein [Bacteroidaceae bacterium]|nr:tetratricopeptide repeat protein [Bacteroidaceae bacterium]